MKELPSEKASHELTVAMHSAEDGDWKAEGASRRVIYLYLGGGQSGQDGFPG